jgi:hypothetical protein
MNDLLIYFQIFFFILRWFCWGSHIALTGQCFVIYGNWPRSKLPNCREKTETNVSLIAYNCVLYHVRAHRFLPFTLHAPSIRKAISWSVTVYNKTLSSQCNVTAPTEPAQDKKEYLSIVGKYTIYFHSLQNRQENFDRDSNVSTVKILIYISFFNNCFGYYLQMYIGNIAGLSRRHMYGTKQYLVGSTI